MIITIQWMDCENGAIESAEGRFVIIRDSENNCHTILERCINWPDGEDQPVARINASSFPTQEECQLYAHKRLAKYWNIPA